MRSRPPTHARLTDPSDFKYASTLTASTFGSLVFAVNGYSGGQNQRVEFYYNGGIIGNQLLIATYTGGSVPTTWTQVSIPIGDFGLSAGQLIDGVVFQANTGGTTLQVRFVRFVCPSQRSLSA